jgi:hypothetical protein
MCRDVRHGGTTLLIFVCNAIRKLNVTAVVMTRFIVLCSWSQVRTVTAAYLLLSDIKVISFHKSSSRSSHCNMLLRQPFLQVTALVNNSVCRVFIRCYLTVKNLLLLWSKNNSTRATLRNIPEDVILHSHLRGNLKSCFKFCFSRVNIYNALPLFLGARDILDG